MKKVFFAALFLFSVATMATAQSGPQGKRAKEEKIESLKIAFFTEKLQLTPNESKQFWPLYNQFEKEYKELKEKYGLNGKKLELMSDAEVEDFVMGQVQMAEDQAKIRRDYTLSLKEVLPIRKVAMLPDVNREFKKVLLEEIRRRRQQRQGNNGHRPRPGGN